MSVVVGRTSDGSRIDHDFHSLVWKTKVGTNWLDYRTIDQAAFQARFPRRRWVSSVHSFDGINGTAVILVAEESAPTVNGNSGIGSTSIINVVYSWREWSLLTNCEVRFFRNCTNPLENY
jgi:hypothetical protein